jgi:cytochrome c oxidase accessory protein FixG
MKRGRTDFGDSNLNAPRLQEPEPAGSQAAQPIDWADFRDHLSTADQTGRRRWLYPRKPSGRFYTARKYVSWLLLFIMFAGPFVRINGNPLLLLNVVDRKFVILGQIFWPQDVAIFAVATLLYLMGILVFTAAFGRLWCGWTCPQTLLMEMVFRRIEYSLEGDPQAQRALARAPWNARKVLRKGVKHFIFLGLSFVVGNTLLAYIIGSERLFQIITDHPANHVKGLTSMILFTLVFYSIFARFREQACTFICPYGRFQSTVMDENTIVVAYDHVRGEARGHLRRGQTAAERQAAGHGDCIDCRQCVAVCPTGIDIRNGTQMECVHCTACIDACAAVMERIRRPKGLIRYASFNGIERGEKLKITPRLVGYTTGLLVLGGLLAFLLFTRPGVEASLLRAPGALYQTTPEGNLNNLYLLKLINKTSRAIPVQLKLENHTGQVTVIGKDLVVPPENLVQTSVLIELPPEAVTSGKTALVVGVYSNGRRLERIKTVFVGPERGATKP